MKDKKSIIYRSAVGGVARLVADLAFTALLVLLLTPLASPYGGDAASAEEAAVAYPTNKTFTISAYYSPLPCQNQYNMGSYEAEIRMNGSGVNGADGTAVYPGMIAAPKTYAFGTKMHIPGVGIVAVHDRGGAIVANGGVEGVYDRLDVWMGYGDIGLKRALSWGKRTVDVAVYGQNDEIVEQIELAGYTPAEANRTELCGSGGGGGTAPIVDSQTEPVVINTFASALDFGDTGKNVEELQKELVRLNYYRGPITGYYGEVTEHAVFKFQQAQGIITDVESLGAGVFGPRTGGEISGIVADRNSSRQLIAQTTESFNNSYVAELEDRVLLAGELQFGMVGLEVQALQEFLDGQGYFDAGITTQYFGSMTRDAVLRFQMENNIVLSEGDRGAGRVGPSTLRLINDLAGVKV